MTCHLSDMTCHISDMTCHLSEVTFSKNHQKSTLTRRENVNGMRKVITPTNHHIRQLYSDRRLLQSCRIGVS